MAQKYTVTGSVSGNTEDVKVGIKDNLGVPGFVSGSSPVTIPAGGGSFSIEVDNTAHAGRALVVQDRDQA
jgi:hypothetical protein